MKNKTKNIVKNYLKIKKKAQIIHLNISKGQYKKKYYFQDYNNYIFGDFNWESISYGKNSKYRKNIVFD